MNRFLRDSVAKWRGISFDAKLNLVAAFGSFFVGVMAIVLTVIALWMTMRQGEITERQAQIAETQFKAFQEQTARKADLVVSLMRPDVYGDFFHCSVALTNRGNKAANGVSWRLKINGDDLKGRSVDYRPLLPDTLETITLDEKTGVETERGYSGYIEAPIFLGDEIELFQLLADHVADLPPTVTIEWTLMSNDDSAPPEGIKGHIIIPTRQPMKPGARKYELLPLDAFQRRNKTKR